MRPFTCVRGLFLCPKIIFKEGINMSAEIINDKFEGLVGSELINTAQMYESLRYNDYSVENGLGEIVDNSVEAGANEIRIDFKKRIQQFGKKQVEENLVLV